MNIENYKGRKKHDDIFSNHFSFKWRKTFVVEDGTELFVYFCVF